MIEQGALIEEILEGYPSLTREMVESAAIYAAAQPRSGQTPAQSWSGMKPVTRVKRRPPRLAPRNRFTFSNGDPRIDAHREARCGAEPPTNRQVNLLVRRNTCA